MGIVITSRCVLSPAGARTTRLGVDERISRRSRRKDPKKGTTQHSGIARALFSALSYSTERSAAERKSSVGTGSFSVIDSQKGFNFVDLRAKTNR